MMWERWYDEIVAERPDVAWLYLALLIRANGDDE
jgi:hypothetical protein